MSILIAGDFAPIRKYETLLTNGAVDFIDDAIHEEIKKNAYFVVNLEAPLADRSMNEKSALPQLVANPNVIKGMKLLNIDACSLGNNHILDAGYEGVKSTIKALEKNGISHFGAGNDSNDSKRLLIKEMQEKKIGFYAISNNEYSIATDEYPGANPENIVDWYYDIPKFKSSVDYLIIFYHTGIEKSMFPSPQMQKKAKLLIDLGSDLVTFQHSHVIGVTEDYKGKKIVYGQGDFVFDYGSEISDFRRFGSFLKLNLDDEELKIEYIFFKKEGANIKLLSGKEKTELEQKIQVESAKIANEEFILNNYEIEIKKKEDYYMNIFLSFGNYYVLKVLNKLNFTKVFFRKGFRKILFNIVQNDIHRSMLAKILKKRL